MKFLTASNASVWIVFLASMMIPPSHCSSIQAEEYYEVRTYVLGDKGDEAELDGYLKEAYIPALNRMGIEHVGALAPTDADKTDLNGVVVVIPYSSLSQIQEVKTSLQNDAQYQEAARSYLSRPSNDPPYQRIRSELLSAMDCWPGLKVADGSLENDDRVYELRLYESANERLGDLKVDMFNNGEVPIFLDCNITPIFIGQCLLGPQTPSLTYLTVYSDEQARAEAWKAFRVHPDWQVLKVNPKYSGTVSRIDKFVLGAKPYSQL